MGKARTILPSIGMVYAVVKDTMNVVVVPAN